MLMSQAIQMPQANNSYVKFCIIQENIVEIHYDGYKNNYFFVVIYCSKRYNSNKYAWGWPRYKTEQDCIEACTYFVNYMLEDIVNNGSFTDNL